MNTSKEDDKKQSPVGGDTGTSSPMDGLVAVAAAAAAIRDNKDDSGNKKKKRKQSSGQQKDGAQISAARARRLEQNRRAAIESRRRKKVMIGELQRSVTFYSKANENLKKSNEELEELLLVAKQKLSQKDGAVSAVATGGGLKTPEEDQSSVVGSPGVEAKAEHQPAPVASIPTPFASVDPPNVAPAEQARFSAMQALYENMGYPAVAARSAASVFSQFGTDFDDAKKPDPVLPDIASVDSDAYIQKLEQYALLKTAAANAATLAANEALRIANWHKMMKTSGQNASTSDGKPSPVASVKEEK
ncbi:hypothetical protein ACHAWT_009616 [Skeletonema menzelii]